MRTTVIGGFIALLVAGGVWITYEATSAAMDTDREGCEPRAKAEVLIAAVEARLRSFVADMRARRVPEHIIAARQAQVEAMFEQARSETWRPGLTSAECLEAYERVMAGAVERGFITPAHAAEATEDYKGAAGSR